jgi:hypothetical protein
MSIVLGRQIISCRPFFIEGNADEFAQTGYGAASPPTA